ncbi:S41 family peptidase [Flavobacterium sp. WC2409]|uniref:S41 family peptidase n=1 Tax=Flavobacterium sp. WC2409 TaxID=3234139 RepID=A0AB39VY07_9FLAO
MKKLFTLVFVSILFIQCASIKKHNSHLNDLISAKDLKSDVDFTYKKLQQLHPDLYEYITKKELDSKFDSLKTTIRKPMTSLAFYKKLSPVVAAIRQGHTFVYAPTKLMSKKVTKAITKKGTGPFSQFNFDFINDKLYVVKNKSNNKTIKPGTEVVSVNEVKPINLIEEYNTFYSSDGYNTTLKKRYSGKRFSSYFTIENGLKDSLNYVFKINDSLKKITILRHQEDTTSNSLKKNKLKKTAFNHAKRKVIRKKKRVNGYNKTENIFNRNLRFIEKDSSIAILKINSFKLGDFRTFYKESFNKIDRYKSKTLILDLRDNGGGRLNEIVNLYTYLADSSFVFIDESEVVSKSSLLKGAYFSEGTFVEKIIKTIYSPLLYGYLFLTVHKGQNGKNYYATQTRLHKINKAAFKGKIYVLINGGSFSASSIISSNLKGSKRATFVGQETGGGYNGTVAGFMPKIKLPKSDIKIRIGLMLFAPHYKTDQHGHGIFPDQEIIPTLQNKIEEIDVELNWVLEDIKKQKTKHN